MESARFHFKNVEIEVLKGDITEIPVDAIVNAANKYLKHGGGVAAAIVKKGGEVIQRESDKIISNRGPLEVGETAVTSAGRLLARYVIHTVGPIWGEGREEEKLTTAVLNCLKLAEKLKLKSVSFPAISTGTYGMPAELAADAIIGGILKYVDESSQSALRKVILVLHGGRMHKIFLETLKDKLKKSSK